MSKQQIQPAVITISIGNSNITEAPWSAEGKLIEIFYNSYPSTLESIERLAAWLQSGERKCSPVVIAGVVPRFESSLIKALKKSKRQVLAFRKNLVPEIEIVPEPPDKVGDDRIAAALGALALDPTVPWIVVDAGTALTCNAITPARRGKFPRFEGGLIVPGAALSLKALARQTAQLPDLNTDPGDATNFNFIGHSTEQAMRHGVMLAQVATLLVMLEGQKGILGPQTRAVLTGGGAVALYDAIRRAGLPPLDLQFNRWLVHLGLFSVWRKVCPAS